MTDNLTQTLYKMFGSLEIDPAYDPVDYRLLNKIEFIFRLCSRYFDVSVDGTNNIPNGPALMIGNHGLFGFDGLLLGYHVYKDTGRLWRTLCEHMLFAMPGIRSGIARLGGVDGTRENAIKFLKAGHLVNVYPGGARDALKDKKDLYRLQWDNSKGYVKVAIKAQAPILLHAGMGTDDSYKILGRLKIIGRLLNNNRYELPLVLGLGVFPLPVKFDYYITEPIYLDAKPEDANDPVVVDKIHNKLRNRLQHILYNMRCNRRSRW